MGRQLVRLPPGFCHPRGQDGALIPGAHLEQLWYTLDEQKTCFQIYENVSEGTPVSPIFASGAELCGWLTSHGVSAEAADLFLKQGFAPSFVLTENGLLDGIQGLTPPL